MLTFYQGLQNHYIDVFHMMQELYLVSLLTIIRNFSQREATELSSVVIPGRSSETCPTDEVAAASRKEMEEDIDRTYYG